MQDVYKALTALALDPFARLAAAGDARRALLAVGFANTDLELARAPLSLEPESIANGSFSSCETCIDPGDDPDPFVS